MGTVDEVLRSAGDACERQLRRWVGRRRGACPTGRYRGTADDSLGRLDDDYGLNRRLGAGAVGPAAAYERAV
ncbi:hypothetical protein ACFYSH_24120 [Streptomyces sp. NPDC005791]|uniref:hypothetical protein n=1 Tax=Streptomyces sp. NPDC005791 TaxID=3364732 RepID=UPI0036C270B7